MAIPIISRVTWITKTLGTTATASLLGVSTRAVNYWMTGQRVPTTLHQTSLARLYEQAQYRVMRDSGISPISASKYRGLSPESFDAWHTRLDDMLDSWTSGHVGARIAREGLDVDKLTRRQFQDIYDEERERLLKDIDESDDDISELEASP